MGRALSRNSSVNGALGLACCTLDIWQVEGGVDRCAHVVVLWAGLDRPLLGEADLLS